MPNHDTRYDFVVCKACGRQWLHIDFRCMTHRFICNKADTAEMIPVGELKAREDFDDLPSKFKL